MPHELDEATRDYIRLVVSEAIATYRKEEASSAEKRVTDQIALHKLSCPPVARSNTVLAAVAALGSLAGLVLGKLLQKAGWL